MCRSAIKKNFWNCTMAFWGLTKHAPKNTAQLVDWPALVSWWLKRPSWDFKNSFCIGFLHINRAKYFFPGRSHFFTIHNPHSYTVSCHRVVVSCFLSMKFAKIYRTLDFCSKFLLGLISYKKENLMSELLILQSLSIGHTDNEI